MHETGIVDKLINKMVELAQKEGRNRITKVTVQLGALSQMSSDHFKEHFVLAAKDSIAEGAEVETILSEDVLDIHAPYVLLKSVEFQ